ncbi:MULTISPECIES: lasso peptide biosynthesis B2 protein [Actinosynnema]|uniref:lasso peptide biosynthesis B2 protein n=1 Tax=Actinosynnema TaxID=40566 RepID=UPI0020A54DFF|nr:lasso peptide biosynthesis B2 protein [Actinosynnema pretiosum]MCP2094441.1 Transglutaminase-like superfamily protein [Actinosynnema pretiosum]
MAQAEHVVHDPGAVPVRRRWAVRVVAVVAAPLALLPPNRLRALLTALSRRARPASASVAAAARRDVVLVTLSCAGPESCLRRSLAAALLCRASGTWPTWCVGVRRVPPFGAHAWIEVDGDPVGEGVAGDYFQRLITVPAGRAG